MSAGHGTDSRYKNRLNPCRCNACTEAHREYERARRAAVDVNTLTHGRRATYDAGCRCDLCYTARQVAYYVNEAKSQRFNPGSGRRIVGEAS